MPGSLRSADQLPSVPWRPRRKVTALLIIAVGSTSAVVVAGWPHAGKTPKPSRPAAWVVRARKSRRDGMLMTGVLKQVQNEVERLAHVQERSRGIGGVNLTAFTGCSIVTVCTRRTAPVVFRNVLCYNKL